MARARGDDLARLHVLEAKIREGEELTEYELKQLGRLEGIFGRKCVICGYRFKPRRKDHIYCSGRCKVKAHWLRKRAGKSG